LEIPINSQGFEDFVAWHVSKHGRYTVRSAYHVQWNFQFGHNASVLALPGGSATNPVWKTIWKLKVPPKVKFFCWRALHGIIPLKCILANRHIGTSAECPICHQGPEDIMHLLFTCPATQVIWQELGIFYIIQEASVVDLAGSAALEYILRDSDHPFPGITDIGLKEAIVVSCWYIWWMRRQRVHGEQVPPPYKCKMSILGIALNARSRKSTPTGEEKVQWSKPETRFLKLNVDAAFYDDSRSGSFGAVIRDFQGNFVGAKCGLIPSVASASMAEAMAMREGLVLANSMGINRLIAESDSMETVEACSGEERWWNESAAVYADCIDLSSSIGTVKFKHYPREANHVAHELAKLVINPCICPS
jgi:ribonuclease HI